MSTEALLMEAMRQLDEVRRLGPDMPPMSSQVSMSVPLIPPLRDLSPDELDVLQLCHNYGHVETVLNKSLASDLETQPGGDQPLLGSIVQIPLDALSYCFVGSLGFGLGALEPSRLLALRSVVAPGQP